MGANREIITALLLVLILAPIAAAADFDEIITNSENWRAFYYTTGIYHEVITPAHSPGTYEYLIKCNDSDNNYDEELISFTWDESVNLNSITINNLDDRFIVNQINVGYFLYRCS